MFVSLTMHALLSLLVLVNSSSSPLPDRSSDLLSGEGTSCDFAERPRRIEGADPGYTPKALEARVEGTVIVRCRISTAGVPEECAVLKSLPYLDEAALAAARSSRYTPVLCEGKPVSIQYIFAYRFRLPSATDGGVIHAPSGK